MCGTDNKKSGKAGRIRWLSHLLRSESINPRMKITFTNRKTSNEMVSVEKHVRILGNEWLKDQSITYKPVEVHSFDRKGLNWVVML
jgi:hypothetical protein